MSTIEEEIEELNIRVEKLKRLLFEKHPFGKDAFWLCEKCVAVESWFNRIRKTPS